MKRLEALGAAAFRHNFCEVVSASIHRDLWAPAIVELRRLRGWSIERIAEHAQTTSTRIREILRAAS